jgi:putative ABC transport system permease protein
MNAIVLNERFINLFPDMQPGDTLRIKVLGKESDMTVVGFFQLAGRSGGYLGYTTYEQLSDLMGASKQASVYRILADEPDLSLKEQEALGELIDDHLRAQGYAISEISAGQSMTKKTSDGINILIGFLLVMASLTAAVGSIGLTGTMSLNVLERTREIGITRAIGASNRTVMNLVIVEGVLIGMLSWLFGALLSFPISTIMSNAINLSLFGAPAAFTFTPTGVILWLVAVLLLSVLASVMPARNAARLTIREVLAYE